MTAPAAPSSDQKPLILLTNDDGVHAPGLAALAEAITSVGEVIVAAPDRNNSGASHQITLHRPLRSIQVRPGWWQIDGSPADSVYLAIHEHLAGRQPDLCISGINAGPNLSFDVHYSGTVGAAFEAALMGVQAIAVSLCDYRAARYEHAAEFAADLARQVLKEGLPTDTILNVNVPAGAPTDFQMTFLGHRLFKHEVHRRDDPRGSPYFWVGGVPGQPDNIAGSDCTAVEDGFISVTPLSVDLTNARALRGELADWRLDRYPRRPGRQAPDRVDIRPLRD
ncbi:MAG: 5'/3'-nucleotidase SurE [Myxococcota bacterium]